MAITGCKPGMAFATTGRQAISSNRLLAYATIDDLAEGALSPSYGARVAAGVIPAPEMREFTLLSSPFQWTSQRESDHA